MIKSELIDIISRKYDQLPVTDVSTCVTKILEKMSQSLLQGKRVEIRGFGSFELRYCRPRKAHNPKTGEALITKATFRIGFKPGKELKERVNESTHHNPSSEVVSN